ncbi:unnamed protein product [Periconia digitata]|uniref:Uncharacterized protein n=1 Tax=Periconia digitata TaxID=1303443 RepID=A0A9W4U934_9PLEO|nr:unnamed protein product [Periconia digitata]
MARSPDPLGQTWGLIPYNNPKTDHSSGSSDKNALFVRDLNSTPPAVPLEERLENTKQGLLGVDDYLGSNHDGKSEMDLDRPSAMHTRLRSSEKHESSTQAGPSNSRPVYQEISTDEEDEDDEDDMPLRAVRARTRPAKPAAAPPAKPEPSESSRKQKYNYRNKPAQPISAKPVSKNDMQAKIQLIREIEKYWGKDFIRTYIPKCHRPLTKRKNGKRSMYRVHETDPKNWLPSVLKAVLMVAKQTDDKIALKKAMDEVVRYRIKHTGNRKPQLVTTDFDVIEDIVIGGWKCQDSFKLRYKHLLSAQSSNIHVSNAEVDAIMYPDSGYEDTDEDSPPRKNRRVHQSEEEEDEVDDELGEDEEVVYIQTHPFYPPKKIIQRKSQPSKKPAKPTAIESKKPIRRPSMVENEEDEETQNQPEQPPYSGYGAPGGYPPYTSFGGYGYPPYGYPPHFKGYPQVPYGYYPFNPYHQYSGFNSAGHHRDPRSEQDGTPEMHRFPPASHHQMTPSPAMPQNTVRHSKNHQGDFGGPGDHFSPFVHPWGPPQQPFIKQEPGLEDYAVSIEDNQHMNGGNDKPIYVEDDGNEIDMDYLDEKTKLELEAAEAEVRLAKMRANAAKASRAAKATHTGKQHMNSRDSDSH